MMRIYVLTLFPEVFNSVLGSTMLRKAQERGAVEFRVLNIRDWAEGKHRVTDDTPYGGGPGMVMKPEPIVAALESLSGSSSRPYRILLSPSGQVLDQRHASELARKQELALICGRYEGVDARVTQFVDEELSIGDYVLSGGEIAAMVVMDVITRLLPGALGCEDSVKTDSFSDGLLEYPQYTRPPEFRGLRVPEVLLSGNHEAIARWRRQQSLRLTRERRPDLLLRANLTEEDKEFLKTLADPGHG